MCGIAGAISLKNQKIDESLINAMIQPLRLRGPDDRGIWCDDNVGLGHTRLSIHDLTASGKQPMFSASKRWVIAFNGEIYNFKRLKVLLLNEFKIEFSSNSDTEVLINAIDCWGIEKTLKQCIGMFAFAAMHIPSKKIYLARDRFGEKPLYYGLQNQTVAFASELKALKPLKNLGWNFDVDRDAVATYMRYAYVPTPYSIYSNISKLEPGCYLKISQDGEQQCKQYWQAQDVLQADKFLGSYEEAVYLLELKLKDTLTIQMSSEVPLGAFLSGGVDSSTIVALMQSMSKDKINTFSIGFAETEYNEANYAQAVAKHLGTNHVDMYVSEKDALDIIPYLPNMYDEPFADSSQIPTYLVSNIAKTKVTVSLTGDAGDELFCGYNRYFLADKVKSHVLGKPLVRLGLKTLPLGALKFLAKPFKRYSNLLDKLLKLQNILRYSTNCPIDLYRQVCSQVHGTDMVMGSNEYPLLKEKKLLNIPELSYKEWMMFADSKTYMIDDILTKVDRAAMAVSLETRVPFLDHRIYEFAWSLPLEYKAHNGVSKRVLRDILYRYVPKKLIERPKMGFGVPIAKWLRGELKDWAAALLDPGLIQQQGYLDHVYITKLWNEHQSGKQNCQAALWTVLMFQSWMKYQEG